MAVAEFLKAVRLMSLLHILLTSVTAAPKPDIADVNERSNPISSKMECVGQGSIKCFNTTGGCCMGERCATYIYMNEDGNETKLSDCLSKNSIDPTASDECHWSRLRRSGTCTCSADFCNNGLFEVVGTNDLASTSIDVTIVNGGKHEEKLFTANSNSSSSANGTVGATNASCLGSGKLRCYANDFDNSTTGCCLSDRCFISSPANASTNASMAHSHRRGCLSPNQSKEITQDSCLQDFPILGLTTCACSSDLCNLNALANVSASNKTSSNSATSFWQLFAPENQPTFSIIVTAAASVGVIVLLVAAHQIYRHTKQKYFSKSAELDRYLEKAYKNQLAVLK